MAMKLDRIAAYLTDVEQLAAVLELVPGLQKFFIELLKEKLFIPVLQDASDADIAHSIPHLVDRARLRKAVEEFQRNQCKCTPYDSSNSRLGANRMGCEGRQTTKRGATR